MELIEEFIYKQHEVIIMFNEHEDNYEVDIRIDDYDGHLMAGYSQLGSESEAISVARAFIDGLCHVEEEDLQNR